MRMFLISLFEPLYRRLFAHMCRTGMILMCADAPDTSGQQAAAVMQAEMSKEQLEWAKEIYAETAPDRAAATERANAVSDAQLASMDVQNNMAQDYANYQKDTFRPLEQGIVADAAAFDTPERRAAESADAMAKVGAQFDVTRGAARRDASATGVDPSSGNFASRMGTLDVVQAAQQAGAGNAAAKNVETIGAARKMDAANLGRGLASSQATSASLALTAGNNSTATAQVPLQVAQSGATLLNQGYGGAQGGMANAAGTFGSIANGVAGTNASNAAGMGAAGAAVGTIAVVI
ncbi:hypothetical protein [Polaromonas sp.]|uniref:hypothetical protein n=1 Tax=Polaromonas sp. TaxID=1869339 RepID=UPI0032657A75